MFRIEFYILVFAVEGGFEKLGAKLKEVDTNLTARMRECIESVEIDIRCDDRYDTARILASS